MKILLESTEYLNVTVCPSSIGPFVSAAASGDKLKFLN